MYSGSHQGDSGQCLGIFLVVTTWGVVKQLHVKDDIKHPTMHRPAPTTESYLAQDVNTVEVKKLIFTEY